MPFCQLDHITVTSPTLEAGAQFIWKTLGVKLQPGGAHPRMGTHNLLLRLGDAMFIEVISPDPHASAPGRPRWFGLDGVRSDTPPALTTWVACTSDIYNVVSAAAEPLGGVEPMRRGALDWLITIPADGSVPLDGVGPALIEWQTGPHPATRLDDLGLSLVKLEIFHSDPARVARLLGSIHFDGLVSLASQSSQETPYLVAHIDTPQGVRKLSAPGALI